MTIKPASVTYDDVSGSVIAVAGSTSIGIAKTADMGVPEAPSDGSYYSRRNATWSVAPTGISDAPSDTNAYGRKAGAWVDVTEEAPSNGSNYVRKDGGWSVMPTGFTNPMTTLGDIITGGASGVAQRLGIGTSSQVLTVVSGSPAWANLPVFSLSNFTEALDTSSPNATIPVASLTANNAATDVDAVFRPKGAGSLIASIPNSLTSGGNKRGANATDWQRVRLTAAQIASGANSTLSGGNSNSAIGALCTVSGGNSNSNSSQYGVIGGGNGNNISSSGAQCSIGGGGSNQIQGTSVNSTVSGGSSNTLNADNSVIGGGSSNNVTNQRSVIPGGFGNTASGDTSVVSGGSFNTADGAFSIVHGGQNGNTRGIYGAEIRSVHSFSDTQVGRYLFRAGTSDATPTVMSTNGSSAGAAFRITLPNNGTYAFTGKIAARSNATGNSATWTVAGAIKRGANAAATALVGTPTVTSIGSDAGAATWAVAFTANTTTGCLEITVTGAAATSIKWFATIETAEVSG